MHVFDQSQWTIVDDATTNRFVMSFPGGEAFAVYRKLDDYLVVSHTEVPTAFRGRGIGEMATEALLERARLDGARRAYLLTTTAAPFFEELGFTRIERAEMPEAMLATRQASALCPQSAAVFEKALGA